MPLGAESEEEISETSSLLSNSGVKASESDVYSEPNNQFKNNLIGMLLQTLSISFLMSTYAIFKYVSSDLNVSLCECILIQYFVQNIIAWILWYLPSSITKKESFHKLWYGEKQYRYNLWLRGFFIFLDIYLYYKGITVISIGDVEAIYYLSPIIIAFGGRILLKEQFAESFKFTFILTIIGLLILCQPKWLIQYVFNDVSASSSSSPINLWGLIALVIACIAWAGANLLIRSSKKAHWIQMEIISSLQVFAVWTPLLILINFAIDINLDNNGFWIISFEIFCLISLMAVCMGCGLLFSVLSYQYGETTKVSFMEYINVPFGYILQYLYNQEYPNVYELIGASIVMSTCLIAVVEQYLQYKNELKKNITNQNLISNEILSQSDVMQLDKMSV